MIAVYHHPWFLQFKIGAKPHPTDKALSVLYCDLLNTEIANRFAYPEFSMATDDILLLNHTQSHLDWVKEATDIFYDEDQNSSIPSVEKIARLAVGATVDAVDRIMNGQINRAFLLTRPGGHHAEAESAMGYCYFNNVAIAARYAQQQFGVKRILIVDWDVHHGNGTQKSFYDTDQVLYFSTHEYPLYPATGYYTEIGQDAGLGYTINLPLTTPQGDLAFIGVYQQLLSDIARQYKPELIIVSAGFDIHQDDQLGHMKASSECFEALTHVMLDLAEQLCEGKILFCMEGGYSRTGVYEGVHAMLDVLSDQQANKPSLVSDILGELIPEWDNAMKLFKQHWSLLK